MDEDLTRESLQKCFKSNTRREGWVLVLANDDEILYQCMFSRNVRGAEDATYRLDHDLLPTSNAIPIYFRSLLTAKRGGVQNWPV